MDLDLIILFLSLLIFFYSFELACKFITYVRRKEEKKENIIEAFEIDDITDNKLLLVLCFFSSAIIIFFAYKYFSKKSKIEATAVTETATAPATAVTETATAVTETAPSNVKAPEEGFSLGNLFGFSGDVSKDEVKAAISDVKNLAKSDQVKSAIADVKNLAKSEQGKAMIKQTKTAAKSALKGALKSKK